jgi:SAM-dependent methyltransferase
MLEADAAFTGSIPEYYDTHLVPFLFAPYARELTARVVRLGPSSVLEIAAGTGVVTRELSRALPDAAIVATDLNAAMIDYARALGACPNATFAQADAMALPFEDARFDVVVCQFGIMFFPDRGAAFAEARRVLRPGGTFLASVWAGIEDNDAQRIAAAVVARAFPNDPPTFLQRTPHGFGDPIALERDLRTAGFVNVVCDDVSERSYSVDASGVARGLIEGSPLRAEIVARDPSAIPTIVAQVERALAASLGTPLDGALRAFVCCATRA